MFSCLSVCFILITCSACAGGSSPQEEEALPRVSVESLAEIREGMSFAEVEDIFGSPGRHQFTVSIDGKEIRCVTHYRSGQYGRVYFVFENDRLLAASHPPPFEQKTVPYRNTLSVRRVYGDPQDVVQQVLNSDNLIGPELVAALKPLPAPKTRVDPGLTAAYLVTRIFTGGKARESKRRETLNRLLDRFDPFQIDLGMMQDDVEARLGKPKIIEALEDGTEKRYYGSIDYGLSYSRERMWLTVDFKDAEVIRVYTNDFLNFHKIRELEQARRGKG